tara:strand:+ start:246 stop:392 length:147 start_codon:yes stop_codon:yes gene_type:complete
MDGLWQPSKINKPTQPVISHREAIEKAFETVLKKGLETLKKNLRKLFI